LKEKYKEKIMYYYESMRFVNKRLHSNINIIIEENIFEIKKSRDSLIELNRTPIL